MRLFFIAVSTVFLLGMAWSCSDKKTAGTDRYCFTLDLRSDSSLIRQYRYLHTPEGIWPEIPAGIRQAGCRDMEIYLLDNRMFLIVEIDRGASLDRVWTAMGNQPRQDEWAAFVRQFQQAVPDSSPEISWKLMEPVFDLDQH